MKRAIATISFLVLSTVWSAGATSEAWIHLPKSSETRDPLDWPARLILGEDGSGTIEVLFAGVRRQVYTIRRNSEIGSVTLLRSGETSGRTVQLHQENGILTLVDPSQSKPMSFSQLPEWSARFDRALPAPAGKEEAIAVLSRIIGPEVGRMKKEELFSIYALGYSNLIHGALGTDDRNSPLAKQLVSKYGDLGFDLFIDYWQSEQRKAPLRAAHD